jgi:hypothetical protein
MYVPDGYTALKDPDGNIGLVKTASVDKYLERTERTAGDGKKCIDPEWSKLTKKELAE